MSLTQELFRDNSFIGTGVYQGFDFLYLYVTNLSLLENNYRILLHVKVFSTLVSFLLPISIYYLCRFMGAGKDSSIVASLSLFTVSSIVSWGELKNDIVSAGLFLFFLAVLCISIDSFLEKGFLSNQAQWFNPCCYYLGPLGMVSLFHPGQSHSFCINESST